MKMNTKELMSEYKYDDDILCEDDERTRLTKQALWKLSEPDRLLIILYAEIQSLRKLGELLGISRTTAYFAIKRIRQEIVDYVNSHS